MTRPVPEGLVLDACLTITFGNRDSLDWITGIGTYDIFMSPRAIGEVARPPASEALEVALDQGLIRRTSIDLSVPNEQDALARFDSMPAFRGRGDAEVLALVVTRGHAVGTDERAIKRAVREELTPAHVVSTLDVLVLAVRHGRASIREATRMLGTLDVGPQYERRLADAGLGLADLV